LLARIRRRLGRYRGNDDESGCAGDCRGSGRPRQRREEIPQPLTHRAMPLPDISPRRGRLPSQVVERPNRDGWRERFVLQQIVDGPPRGGVTGRPELDGGVVIPLEVREHVVGRLREAAEDRVQRMIRVDGGKRAISVHTRFGAPDRRLRH
jgi:hypothetical protein